MEERNLWDKIAKEASDETNLKYANELQPIQEKLALRGKEAPGVELKKELKAKLKQLEKKIEDEIKTKIKNEFDKRFSTK